jgi:hypothetical protein
MVPKGDGVHADVTYNFQTMEQSAEHDKMRALKMKLMGPEELQKILDLEMNEFEAGQDSNLLDASVDIANLQVVLKAHRCDSCRLIAAKLSIEFWDLEERFSRFSRQLSDSVVYDGVEAFCEAKNWENDGMTKTVFDKDGNPLEQQVWRLVGPDFETWEARGEMTATSQLWPLRFSKHCSEMAEDYDEVELYNFWKRVTKDSEEPQISDLDDFMCFSHEDADCNKFRNPSEYKQRPVTPEILEDYVEFEDKIQAKKEKHYKQEKDKVIKEHKRKIANAKKRIEQQEQLAAEVAAEKVERAEREKVKKEKQKIEDQSISTQKNTLTKRRQKRTRRRKKT